MELPLFRRLVESQSTPAKAGITEEMLIEPEGKKIHQFVSKFFIDHGQMPTLATVEQETGVPLSTIDASEPTGFYIDLIQKRNSRNKAAQFLKWSVNTLDKENDPAKFFEGVRALLQGVQEASGRKHWDMIDEQARKLILEAYEHIEKFHGKVLGIETPWPSFNEMTGGIEKGHFVSVIARSETGKSWTLLKICAHAHKTGKKVLFISPEMSEEIVRYRLAAIYLELSYSAFRKGLLTPTEKEKLVQFVATPILNNFIIADSAVVQTANQVDMLVLEYRPDIVIVDSYFLLDIEGRHGSTNERREALTIELYQQAKRRKTPYVVSTHFTSKVTKEKKGEAEDVAYTKQAIRLADLAIGLHRDDDMIQNKIMQIQILKHREGVKADILITFDLDKMAFTELQVTKASGEFGHIAPKDENAPGAGIAVDSKELDLGI
jgi:replicative DNA helicase